jgi:hypothetical protein
MLLKDWNIILMIKDVLIDLNDRNQKVKRDKVKQKFSIKYKKTNIILFRTLNFLLLLLYR